MMTLPDAQFTCAEQNNSRRQIIVRSVFQSQVVSPEYMYIHVMLSSKYVVYTCAGMGLGVCMNNNRGEEIMY